MSNLPRAAILAPMRWSQIYLWTTFGLFLLSPLSDKVENVTILIAFIAYVFGSFYIGYVFACANRQVVRKDLRERPPRKQLQRIRLTILAGSLYFAVWGVNQMIDFGAQSFGDIAESVLNPGAAYGAKFSVYERRHAANEVNPITQVLILLSIIYSLFLPLLLIYWRFLSPIARLFAASSICIYIVSFLAIGTQKGLGDVLLLSLAGLMVLLNSGSATLSRSAKKKILASVTLSALVLSLYMMLNQGSRAQEFGLSESLMFGAVSNSYLATLVGESAALGLFSLAGYPSHGYMGLALDLEIDFVFSWGAGLSQAFESYRAQYLGGESNVLLTYPFRAESVTGWPSGMYWSTAFPWFASDLTFLGCGPLMAFAGFLFAKTWIRSISGHTDFLALAALGQFFIFVAYLPANNQVLMQRQGFWVVLTIVGFKVLKVLQRRRR